MKKITSVLCLLALCISVVPNAFGANNKHEGKGTKRMFTTTAYYSPLPNQKLYVTGSYESEIRLNGKGIQGADGTPVYPGMIAGAPDMAFGTQVCIEDFGCGMVHDRGQAIVNKGVRKKAVHDRIDLWMGYGDEGLLRALAWGVRQSKGEVYPLEYENIVSVNFTVPPAIYDLIEVPQVADFTKTLTAGSNSSDVEQLEKYLVDLDLFHVQPDENFDDVTKAAVMKFQKEYFIIDDASDLGAGVFGPQTRKALSEVIYRRSIEKQMKDLWDSYRFDTTIGQGSRNDDVFRLQSLLVKAEYMHVAPTGYFGATTKKALVEFQKDQGVIKDEQSAGAGNFGPATMLAVNTLLDANDEWKQSENKRQFAYEQSWEKGRKLVFLNPLTD